jgi:iron complex outermembrane recepter protein
MCVRAGIIFPAICAAVLSLSTSASSAGESPPADSTATPDSTPAAGGTSTLGSDIKLHFDVAAGPLDKALRDFAVQASRNISYEPSIVAGLQAPAIKGEFTVGDALSRLLKDTKLRAVNVDNKTIRILEKANSAARGAAEARGNHYSRSSDGGAISQIGPDSPPVSGRSPEIKSEDSLSSDARTRDNNDLDEITVTGTHIRGTKNSPSPVLVFTRDDIDATGANTIQQFLQSLPQNFGGASENTIGSIAANSQTNNTVNGSAPNLRGLGADATLVLINGHRVAPGNSDGSFVDISMIPLTAIDRIEIVTDGASAIYGSDAVGGVVNIIMRTKFDGAETRVQYGSVSDGSMHNVQVGQTVGDDWTGGSAVLSYQYFDQTPLSAASRDYLHSVPLPFDLLPEQVQQAVFANVDQEISTGFNIHGDAIYSHRSTNSVFTAGDPIDGYTTSVNPDRIDSYSISLGSTVKLPRQSELAVTGTYSESDTAQQSFQLPSPSPLQFVTKTKSAVISVDANLDGVLASIPAGSIRYAVGAQYRKESFGNTFLFPATINMFYPSREVHAGYVELHVPVIGQTGSSRGDPALELTLADRGERYSDFGSTNNPQIGMIWKALPSVALRGTYGTSFKAPLLSELNPVPAQVAAFPNTLFNPVPGEAIPNTLLVYGGNPNLRPEKARVWTIGLDFKPPEVEGLTTKLTYYDIVFTDEIIVAGASVCSCDAFVDEGFLGPGIVQRNPPPLLVQQLISAPTYLNPFNVDPATIGAIFDSRSMNLSAVKTRGLDFGVGYKRTILGTGIDTGIDGGYIFTYDNQFTSVAPVTSLLNTSYNPINLKLRARALATRGPLSGGVYLNFINAYSDTNVIPYGHVSSWTTADAVVTYAFGSSGAPFNGVTIALSVINLTDRPPPYVSNPFGYPITYDGANANALGRYISLRLQKRW